MMKENYKSKKGRSVENLRSKYEYEFADEHNPYSTYGSPSANQYEHNNQVNAKNANTNRTRSNGNYNAEFSRENEDVFAERSPSAHEYKRKSRLNTNNANKNRSRLNEDYNAEFSKENDNQFEQRKENDGTSSRG